MTSMHQQWSQIKLGIRAEIVFVMEYKHEKAVLKLDPEAWEKVECLDIPDKFYFNQPELRRLLIEKLRPYWVGMGKDL